MLPQFKHRNLPDALADHLVTMIATRQLAAGQRLFEKDICEQLGVSRIPVREALRILQGQGMVRTEPNRGTFVAEFGSPEMHEMLEVRAVVEDIALRRLLLLARSDPKILDAFEVHLDGMRQAAIVSDRLAYCRADLAFHNCLIELSASPMLKPMWDALARDVFVFLMQEREQGYDFHRSVRDHERLLRVMREGKLENIQSELRKHIQASPPASRSAAGSRERVIPSKAVRKLKTGKAV